jgi:cytochrome c-type biogenesis protein CcmF
MKFSAMLLAILSCALCNFATFLTRSGIFSSVHAFSESPIGWMFLAIMSVQMIGGILLLTQRRHALASRSVHSNLLTRETFVLISVFLLLLLTLVVLIGTLVAPVSTQLVGPTVHVGPAFYNNVLLPIGLMLLAMTAVVPLIQWGAPPTYAGRRLLTVCVVISLVVVVAVLIIGVRHPVALAVSGLATLSVTALTAAWLHEAWRRESLAGWRQLIDALRNGRRKYAAYAIHLGFVCVAIGVTGSSVGTQQREVILAEGDAIYWEGRQIHYERLEQQQFPDKLAATAVLEITRDGAAPVELRPARHLHLLQNEWTTEAAIHSTWGGDLYTVLNAGLGDGRVALTLINNPMIRWIWTGGVVATVSAVVAIWPSRRRRQAFAGSTINTTVMMLANDNDERRARAA